MNKIILQLLKTTEFYEGHKIPNDLVRQVMVNDFIAQKLQSYFIALSALMTAWLSHSSYS